MLAPIDKLRSGGNRIIQIVITRNCDIFNCSNCTQLLPFRRDAREMSLECIEEALASMQGWPGVVACFGGNPCAHSRFPEVCDLWQKHIPNQRQRGLWTNALLKHGRVARDTFWPHGVFNLNAHTDSEAAAEMERWLPGVAIVGREPVNHGGMLLDYRDYGYSGQQWIKLREQCDINRNWSGAVYERAGKPHAYFCEVTGALDGVRGENHGIPVEPGWWKWPMEHFQSQVAACVGCGVPLRTAGHKDTERLYDISPSWSRDTERPAGKIGIAVHQNEPPNTYELTDYASLRKPKE